MKILFSEYKSDYTNYIFPYHIWAVPENNEPPSLIFDKGFLPSSPSLDRFYMCRHVRVKLGDYKPSSENRRIMRKGEGLDVCLVDKNEFDFTQKWENFCLDYAELKFGKNVMARERIQKLISSPVISHYMIFTDQESGNDVGIIFLHIEDPAMAFYYYSFYDLEYVNKNLGMFMMTKAVSDMQQKGLEFIYLGSCYSKNALYKTQFEGCQFFNGFKWSHDIKELKYLIERDYCEVSKHLFEEDTYLQQFYPDGIMDTI